MTVEERGNWLKIIGQPIIDSNDNDPMTSDLIMIMVNSEENNPD